MNHALFLITALLNMFVFFMAHHPNSNYNVNKLLLIYVFEPSMNNQGHRQKGRHQYA